jgi:hypothetical protein
MVEHPDPPADTNVWMFGRLPDFRPEGIPDFVFHAVIRHRWKEAANAPEGVHIDLCHRSRGVPSLRANARLDDVPRGIELTPFLQERTVRLWPDPSASVRWPPFAIMDLDLVKRFAQWDQADPLPSPH